MSRMISQLMHDSPLLLLPVISLSLFAFATVLITITTARAKREDVASAARLPLDEET